MSQRFIQPCKLLIDQFVFHVIVAGLELSAVSGFYPSVHNVVPDSCLCGIESGINSQAIQ